MSAGGSSFKDLFSSHAASYAQFRPTYPPELFAYLASLVPRRVAWDCGTGNGQAAVELARFFNEVLATDPSAKQLENAVAHPRVRYFEGKAEKVPIADKTVNLVTVAQAFHWFKHDAFFEEVRRVCVPGEAALAVWSYALASVTPPVDRVVTKFYVETVGAFWEPERKLVEQGYRGIPIPFREIQVPAFQMRARWSLERLIGYLGTWSATQAAVRAKGGGLFDEVSASLRAAWGDPALEREIVWPLSLRVVRC